MRHTGSVDTQPLAGADRMYYVLSTFLLLFFPSLTHSAQFIYIFYFVCKLDLLLDSKVRHTVTGQSGAVHGSETRGSSLAYVFNVNPATKRLHVPQSW